jgi:hypothetical protein
MLLNNVRPRLPKTPQAATSSSDGRTVSDAPSRSNCDGSRASRPRPPRGRGGSAPALDARAAGRPPRRSRAAALRRPCDPPGRGAGAPGSPRRHAPGISGRPTPTSASSWWASPGRSPRTATATRSNSTATAGTSPTRRRATARSPRSAHHGASVTPATSAVRSALSSRSPRRSSARTRCTRPGGSLSAGPPAACERQPRENDWTAGGTDGPGNDHMREVLDRRSPIGR